MFFLYLCSLSTWHCWNQPSIRNGCFVVQWNRQKNVGQWNLSLERDIKWFKQVLMAEFISVSTTQWRHKIAELPSSLVRWSSWWTCPWRSAASRFWILRWFRPCKPQRASRRLPALSLVSAQALRDSQVYRIWNGLSSQLASIFHQCPYLLEMAIDKWNLIWEVSAWNYYNKC